MKKVFLFLSFAGIVLLSGCGSKRQITKSAAYPNFYTTKPVTVLLLPPINNTDYDEAKDMFHATLNMPICNAGYYVIPPFLSMEIMKQESAYNTEEFLNAPLLKFGEVFGADVALFTIIHKWDKMAILGTIKVEIEYILKSVKTNDILYQRKGNITLNPNIYTPTSITPVGLIVAVAGTIGSTITNAVTDKTPVGIICNNLMLFELPAGRYSPLNGRDGNLSAGEREVTTRIMGNAKENIKKTTRKYSVFTKVK
ncbi:MAG: DUF799 domain-containing protein [Prevotellaceae bacterium]|jgi:hypothetical protein|nr:DUF799 domain-containing protein [Prevotellaceae bacterium]